MLWDWDDQNASQKTCVDSFGKMFSSHNIPIKLVEFFWVYQLYYWADSVDSNFVVYSNVDGHVRSILSV